MVSVNMINPYPVIKPDCVDDETWSRLRDLDRMASDDEQWIRREAKAERMALAQTLSTDTLHAIAISLLPKAMASGGEVSTPEIVIVRPGDGSIRANDGGTTEFEEGIIFLSSDSAVAEACVVHEALHYAFWLARRGELDNLGEEEIISEYFF